MNAVLDRFDRVTRAAGRLALRLVMVLALIVLVGIGIGPLSGRYRIVTVLTGSMRPTLAPGAVAISTPEPLQQIRVGQIISFQAPTPGHPVETHRVIQVVKRGARPQVRTQGDANSTPDPWVARLATGPVWVVRARVPGLGTAIHWLRTPWLHLITVLLAPLCFALAALADIWRPRRWWSGARRIAVEA
jgi:signal peptidase